MSSPPLRLVIAALALAALTTQLGSAQADGGALDPSFAGTGVVITATPASSAPESSDLNAVTVQPDGKIVVGGHLHPSAGRDAAFALERYTTNGSLDPSFGNNGLVTTDFGVDGDVHGLAIQPDGKIVAAGAAGAVGLARYNADGTLDPTFGGEPMPPGMVESNAVWGGAAGVALQPDGKILVVGGVSGVAVARYNADGSPDASFGTGGGVSTASRSWEYGMAIALAPDGKIVVAGSRANSLTDPGPDRSFLVERFNPDGSPDSGFGSGGIATATVGAWDYGEALALQPDGKILVGGTSDLDSQRTQTLVRFQRDGTLDHSFGDQGIVRTPGGRRGYLYSASSVLLQPDGKVVAAGDASTSSGPGAGFGLARYLPDGSLDRSFGASGIVTTMFGSDTGSPRAAALQPDGKIVAAGATWPSSPPTDHISFALARYLSNDSHALSLKKPDSTGSGTVTSRPLGIACDWSCTADAAQFADQSLVTLTADPLAGSAIVWKGACAGSKRVCTVSMGQAARSVQVTFSRCLVPRLRGKTATAARRAIRRAHCSVGQTTLRRSRRVAKGRVISQKPAWGSMLAAGSKVSFVVSTGRG